MMPAFKERIHQALREREAKGLSRTVKVLEGGNRSALSYEGQDFINFSSNDYLGLASDPELAKAWQDGIDRYGVGSGASPLVSGFSSAHQKLEETLCDWLGFERAILFSSGFSANQAVLFSLLNKDDTLIQDKLNHASLMEAGMLSPSLMKRFRHNDLSHLSFLLRETENALVVTEGVFSMDGDTSPLNSLSVLCKESDAWLMVDDAHGIGVLGRGGSGSCSLAGIKPDLLIVTFGKAFGLSGAAVMCSKEVGNYLGQFARHHVYSTAIPPSQAYALTAAVNMIRQQSWRREKLLELQSVYDAVLFDSEGFIKTGTPIKPYLCGRSESAVALAEQLKQSGFWVSAIRPPTVPAGSARLRITLTAKHTEEQVKALALAIKKWK